MRNIFEETYMNIDFKRELIQLISEISEYTGKLSVYQSQKHLILNNLEKAIPLQYMKNFTTMYQDIRVSNIRVKELILNDIPPKQPKKTLYIAIIKHYLSYTKSSIFYPLAQKPFKSYISNYYIIVPLIAVNGVTSH